jgi:hypothetical protein
MNKDITDLMTQIQLDALTVECKDLLIKTGVISEEDLNARLKYNSQERIRSILSQLDKERFEFDTIDKSKISEEAQKEFIANNDRERQFYSQALVELYK